MRNFIFALLICLAVPTKAAAEPISALITAISTFAGASAVNAFLVRIAVSFVFSALASALRGSDTPSRRQAGIKTESSTTGGSNPQTFILGRYASGGNLMAPAYSQPNSGSAPNRFLTYVIDLSDAPGVTLSRLVVNSDYVTDLQASTGMDHALEGMIIAGVPHVYLTVYDGSQIAADPYMMAHFAADPDRPWAVDMVGTGLAYAVVTFRYNREIFNALPAVRFELDGIPLYDPRFDSTVGGAGAHRWADPTTWAQTDNPQVINYNILRGITLPDGNIWGGAWAEADLPLASWFSAMNECDQAISLAAGGTEIQYRGGFEVSVDVEPLAVIDELNKASSAEASELGGVCRVRVGPPALPVYFFTDDDISADEAQQLTPYPGLDGVYNAIHATYPAPASLWQTRDAPPLYDATLEADDGRRLVADVTLPAVSSDTQVQRLMLAWLRDNRRFRRHGLTLPPEAMILEPLDTVGWTSARNGYTAKVFEVGEITDAPQTLFQGVSLRERDSADFAWVPGVNQVAIVHPVTTVPVRIARSVPSWNVGPATLLDATASPRRVGLNLTWDGSSVVGATGLLYEVRIVGQTALADQGHTADLAAGQLVIAGGGIIPNTLYEARARLVSRQASAWSSWLSATTPALYISSVDFGNVATFFSDAGMPVPYIVGVLPPNDASRFDGELVYLTGQEKMYQWRASIPGWDASVDGLDIGQGSLPGDRLTLGSLTAGLFAAGAIRTRDLVIDESLSISAVDAGFSMGRTGAADFSSDGLYMGRTALAGGGLGFGFNLGRKSPAGVDQYIQHTSESGLKIVNARYGILVPSTLAALWLPTSQTYALPAGTKSIYLTIVGGGGGGQSDAGDATSGGDTLVQLYDGAVYTGISWQADGGLAAAGLSPGGGQSGPHGAGGVGGETSKTNAGGGAPNIYTYYPGGHATGYGAGGGCGYPQYSLGGLKGAVVSLSNIDVSMLAAPNLVVTVGAKGLAGTGAEQYTTGAFPGSTRGGNGSPGAVQVTSVTANIADCGVVPIEPTITGQFDILAGTSVQLFPDEKPGFWEVHCFGGGVLDLNITAQLGKPTVAREQGAISFFASFRPQITSSATAETLIYKFYRTKV